MIDRLEELLLPMQEEQDEALWWNGRRTGAVPRQQEREGMSPGEEQNKTGTQQAMQPLRRDTARETAAEAPQRTWSLQELERIRRAAHRAVWSSAGREGSHPGEQSTVFGAGQRTAAALKDSPAGGRQGLTAQIDARFRRDARRYDGRLGLL